MYKPKFIQDPKDRLDLNSFIQEDQWVPIEFSNIKPGDRILCIRIDSGIRQIVEFIVHSYDKYSFTWNNVFGIPVVSSLDTHLFIAEAYRTDRSDTDDSDLLLG